MIPSRYGVDAVSDIPVSHSADLGPRRNDETVCEPVRVALGSFIWLSGMTRPDIANVVKVISRQAHYPAERHWRAIRKIIACLHKKKDLELVLVRDGDRELSVYVDTGYSDNDNNRR